MDNHSEEYLREIVKFIRQEVKSSKRNANNDTCLICAKKVDSYCKSHALPRFVLNNIAHEGYVYQLNPSHNPLIAISVKDKTGLMNANVFYTICDNCDNTIFKEYETPDKWESFYSLEEGVKQRMLNLIFLKNSCREVYNDLGNEDFSKKIESFPRKFGIDEMIDTQYQRVVDKLDLSDHLANVEIAIRGIKEKLEQFDILFFRKIHRNLPLAAQCTFAPHNDLFGNVINNVFDLKATMRYVTICVYPLGNYSLILIFTLKEDTPYIKPLIEPFKKLTEREKGKFLLASLLGHTSGQVFFNEHSYYRLYKNSTAQTLSSMNISGFTQTIIGDVTINSSRNTDLKNYKQLPDLFG